MKLLGLPIDMTAACAHACAPHEITVAMLRDGSRSSVRETCSCGRTATWLQTNSGDIVALEPRPVRK